MANEMKLLILEEMKKRQDRSQPPLEHRPPPSEHRPPPSEHRPPSSEHRPPEHNELWYFGNFYDPWKLYHIWYVKAIYRIIFV